MILHTKKDIHYKLHEIYLRTHLKFYGDLLSRCVDYIQVDRGIYGLTESCGTEIEEDNMNQLEGRTWCIYECLSISI